MNKLNFSWPFAIREMTSLASLDVITLSDQLRKYPLKGFELEMLGRVMRNSVLFAESTLPVIRVAILAGYTSEPIANAVVVALFAMGYRAELYEAPFGVYRQEILTPGSALYSFKPEIILILAPSDDISNMPKLPLTAGEVDEALLNEVMQWQSTWSEIRANSNAVILQHVFENPENTMLGLAEIRSKWTKASFITELNRLLIAESAGAVLWVDVDNLANLIGRNNWHDCRLKFHGKFAFSAKYLPEYTKLIEGVLRSALAKSRKALILDLDNTLWGGIIGDDGMDGIKLGADSPEGEAYFAFCRYIADLGRRGVILGICSKNELLNVAEVFDKHRHMPLNLNDFAVVRCNWDDKASNIASIASELNIAQDAIVFVDDNPVECELIRKMLPEIYVIQLEGDPSTYIHRLDQERLFDSQEFSSEDLKRTQSYKARKKSESLRTSTSDLGSYLTSLEMVGKVWVSREEDLSRLAQMEAKTNQFNLTTRRWTSEKLRFFMSDKNHDVLCFQMLDCFADHGLVGSMVVRYENDEVRILSWVLSCRVFSRSCEEFMLSNLLKLAMRRGVTKIIGEFIASEKNNVVSGLLLRLGFSATKKDNIFELKITTTNEVASFIKMATEGE